MIIILNMIKHQKILKIGLQEQNGNLSLKTYLGLSSPKLHFLAIITEIPRGGGATKYGCCVPTEL